MKKVLNFLKRNIAIHMVVGAWIGVMGAVYVIYSNADSNNGLSAGSVAISKTNMSEVPEATLQSALDYLYEKASHVGESSGNPKMSDMCPGCKFTYTTSSWYLSSHDSATTLTDSQISGFKTNWEDVVVANSRKNFLGLVVNSSTKKIDRAFACSINNGVPFCIEGVKNGDARKAEVYAANVALLQSAPLYNNGCNDNGSYVECIGSVPAAEYKTGSTQANGDSGYCYVRSFGDLFCREL